MDNVVLVEVVKPIDKLAQNLNGLVFSEEAAFFNISFKISFIAKLHDEVEIVIGLFHVVEFDDVGTFATLQNFYLAFQQFFEFSLNDEETYL